MREILRKHHVSFKTAIDGVVWCLTTQPNFKVHLFLAVTALSAGFFLNVTRIEILILVCTIVLGMVAEMINTAIESVTDLVTTQWRKEAKIAKDVAAGMMLVTAVGAIGIAALVFWPYIVHE